MTSVKTFSNATMDEAWAAAVAEAETLRLPKHLWERPQVKGFTIDGYTSKDLDDAIWIEETETGAIASVHIADVAEIVQVGSAVDKVALARTQTKYYGRGNDPMIPHTLSENYLSLWNEKRRPTLTVQVTLDHQANMVETKIFESWLSSFWKFSYEHADIACQKPKAPFHQELKLCQTWAERLSQGREAMGAFGGLLSKSGVMFDENGNVLVSEGKLFHSQIIIQEFMIMANRAVAQWFADRDVLALYRNHTARAIAPEREQLMNALLTTGNTDLIRQKLQNWLNRAEYNPVLIGHFALNLPAYLHFTSPIRRLPDLINHRIVKAMIHGKRHPYKRFELEQLCQYIKTVTIQEEQELREFHKERTQRRYSKQLLDTESLSKLPEKEFTNVLKHSLRDENFEPLREVALSRLNEGKLTVQDLFMLLVQSGDKSCQLAVLEALKERVPDATSIIAMGLNQEETWDDMDFLEGSSSSPFFYWVQVTIGGLPYTTVHPAMDAKKQGAKQLACLAWLEAYVQGTLVAPEQREMPKSPETVKVEPIKVKEPTPEVKPKVNPILKKAISDGHNTVGLLQEVCLKSKWKLPEYEFTDEEEGFACHCRMIAWGRSLTSSASAPKKKRAKWLAAKEMLEQLQQVVME